jgi:hypothetical protein
MVDWQLTATTIYCDAVQEEVTIFIHKDWSPACTGFNQNTGTSGQQSKDAPVDTAASNSKKGCTGLPCKITTDYINKLMAEESNADG